MNRTENDFSDLRDVVKNWTFSCSGDAPIGMENVVPVVSREISGAYEITTILFGFSNRNVAYHTQVFSADFSCSIPGGNIVEISVSSDDTATLTVGDLTASSTLGHSATAKTESWIQSPAGTLVVAGTYCNIGGPYSLAVSIVIKRTVRKIFFEATVNTPDELNEADAITLDEREKWLAKKRTERTRFGCGEIVFIRVKNTKNEVLRELPIATAGCAVISEEAVLLNTIEHKNIDVEGAVVFEDGEQLSCSARIEIPAEEFAQEISEEEYTALNTGVLVDTSGKELVDVKYFLITVKPTNVSFHQLYFWEVGDVGENFRGVFTSLLNVCSSAHMPSDPVLLSEKNQWTDVAFFMLTPVQTEICIEYSNAPIVGTEIGEWVWNCPVRWTEASPTIDTRDLDECVWDKIPKNELISYSGSVNGRKQSFYVFSTSEEIEISVEKVFNVPTAMNDR